ncbi:hypothetical protein [Mesorhizobium sp. B2-1-2]|uniref:hypothetical protein n=1 Tax=Mesorhizobium sp. B2-1-2 TaxID=2589973 RepID=UPI0011269D68|nr:hypothetical protein [Mesorhizobium sp. B2-1-2]TPN04504.1 hypothetical protein FJ971_29605 [Mesorhizobium sp. B2-1-2]
MTTAPQTASIAACISVMEWWETHRHDPYWCQSGEPEFVTKAREALVLFAAEAALQGAIGSIVESVKEQLSGLLPSDQVAAIGSKFHSGGIVRGDWRDRQRGECVLPKGKGDQE